MNIAQVLHYSRAFVGSRVLGTKTPLVVSMVVTNRCNYSCGYCDRWDGRGERLSTAAVLNMLDDMAAMGTKRLILTGGEPLIRKDIFDIIRRGKTHGMRVNLNSNGTLVPKFMHKLRMIDGLTISIDGDRDVHDSIRGEGAFDSALMAVRAAKDHPNIKVRLSAVISARSIGAEDALLNIARQEGIEVFFQPAEHRQLGGDYGENELAPRTSQYRETISHLIREKEAGAPIANSVSALRYLRSWPDGAALPCAGSLLFCRVDFDGMVKICGRMGEYEEAYSATDLGFREAFLRLGRAKCPTCWCASRVEVNQAFSMQRDALLGLARAAT